MVTTQNFKQKTERYPEAWPSSIGAANIMTWLMKCTQRKLRLRSCRQAGKHFKQTPTLYRTQQRGGPHAALKPCSANPTVARSPAPPAPTTSASYVWSMMGKVLEELKALVHPATCPSAASALWRNIARPAAAAPESMSQRRKGCCTVPNDEHKLRRRHSSQPSITTYVAPRFVRPCPLRNTSTRKCPKSLRNAHIAGQDLHALCTLMF